ncbi:MAG TPA: hypothetical protein DIW64_02730 [Cellvibrio sp.]|nr:hypothetical protein [Cellvibrio sp.]
MTYKINMPHRDRVIYSDEFCEIIFEVEINETESVIWKKSQKYIKGEKEESEIEIKRLIQWLSEKFPNRAVVIDES